MEEKINWRDEALQMPLADLSRIYKRLKTKRMLITTIPIYTAIFVMLIYAIAGWASMASFLYSAGRFTFSIASAWDVIVSILCCCVLIAYHGKPANNIALWLLISYTLIMLLFNTSISIFTLITYVYLAVIRLPMAQIDDDIAFLRAMPTFPFNERVSSSMIEVAEQKRKLQLIESAKGNIYSDNAEQIFDKPVPEMPQYEKGDTPEDYLQRKQFYVDGKYTRTSLTDEEYDRQEDELYERRMFTDKQKKAQTVIAPQPIEDDGRLQDFDYTMYAPPKKEDIKLSENIYAEDFDGIQKTAEQPNEEDIVVGEQVQLEEFDFSDRT
ncbi:MAG: hypothetical protein IKH90_10710 [Ruminococcus sp.]|nr:hypothetical protein [Ruminococcus sp.]